MYDIHYIYIITYIYICMYINTQELFLYFTSSHSEQFFSLLTVLQPHEPLEHSGNSPISTPLQFHSFNLEYPSLSIFMRFTSSPPSGLNLNVTHSVQSFLSTLLKFLSSPPRPYSPAFLLVLFYTTEFISILYTTHLVYFFLAYLPYYKLLEAQIIMSFSLLYGQMWIIIRHIVFGRRLDLGMSPTSVTRRQTSPKGLEMCMVKIKR